MTASTLAAIRASTTSRRLLAVAVLVVGGVVAPSLAASPDRAPASTADALTPMATSSVVDPASLGLATTDLPGGCVAPNRHLSLFAVELPRSNGQVRLGYGLTPDSATYPGPTIEMVEGECLAITLVNEVSEATLAELRDHPRLGMVDPDPADPLPLGVSLHVHGVKYTTSSDGTMHTGSWVPSGQARTYVWYAEPRALTADGRVLSHGTAGYWWYHDHVVGTDHGTGGIGSGLLGALVVRRPGDPVPDRTFALAMGDDASVNLRRYPETDTCDPDAPVPSDTCLVAQRGERVEFVVFGIGNDFHTFHLHGHTWVDDRTGVLTPTNDPEQIVDVIGLGPSESFGFQVVAGASVGAGDWMIHCHVQRHSDLGMFTFLHVVEPGEVAMPPAGPLDTAAPDARPAEALGRTVRGSAAPLDLPDDPLAGERRDLGFWCSLPLSAWATAHDA